MSNKSVWDDRPVLDHVHPLVYGAIVGLVLWFVVSAAWGFGVDGYADYLIAVVGGFMLIAVAIPCVLWLVWWSNQGADAARRDSAVGGETLRDWSAGDLDTWQDRLRGTNAAVEILLPIAAVAFGMTAFGIVMHFAAHASA